MWILLLVLVLSSSAVQLAAQNSAAPAQSAGSPRKLSPSDIQQLKTKAEAGDAGAQLALAKVYESGNGAPQSDVQAATWYRKAADQGNAEAENDLGLMYREGRGVEKSKEEAVNWYRKAARQKHSAAMFNLGTAYYNGDGVPIDDVAAYAWFLLGEEAGSRAAVDAVERQRKEVRPFQESQAFDKIGDMYARGEELPQNYAEALRWYRKAAETGESEEKMKVATILIQGKYGLPDFAEGRRWCQAAAEKAYSAGAYCLGVLSDRGLGAPADLVEAAKWYAKASEMGHYGAMLRLGQMYWKGEGVNLDRISGFAFTFLASNSDWPGAQEERAAMEKQLSEKEIEKAKKSAIKWRTKHPGGIEVMFRKK